MKLFSLAFFLSALISFNAFGGNLSESMPVEQQLAVLDSDYGVDWKDKKTIYEYSKMLDKLMRQYEGTREEIADQTSRIQGVLKDSGIKMTTMDIMRDIDQGKPAKTKVPYKEFAPLYLMLKIKQ